VFVVGVLVVCLDMEGSEGDRDIYLLSPPGSPPEMDYPIKPNSVDGASLFASVGFLLSIPTLGRRGIGATPSKTAMIARRDDTSSSCWRLTRRPRLLGR
jgi:hypothetical protein